MCDRPPWHISDEHIERECHFLSSRGLPGVDIQARWEQECRAKAVDWRKRARTAELLAEGALGSMHERDAMAKHHAILAADAQAALKQYQEATDTVRKDFLAHQDALSKAKGAAARGRHLAVRDEREACAQAAEAWADSQDRIACEKEPDAPASAQSHAESAFIGRRIAGVIRARAVEIR